jgi:ketosteroid isomerase-like protein
MKNLFTIILPLFLFQTIIAQSNKQKQVAIIKASREASNKAIAVHDVDGIAKFIRDDFVQVRGNASYLSGKDSIVNSWKQLFISNPNVKYIRNPDKILISDNDTLAWETGKWIGINSYSKGGNYSAMWRKTNMEWKLQAELFVSLND